ESVGGHVHGGPQAAFVKIEQQIGEIDRFLATAQQLMAVDEPRLSTVPFPLRAAQDAQAALRTSSAILRTLTESICLFRNQQTPTAIASASYIINMAPRARDTSFELHKFAVLMSVLMTDRRSELCPELAKTSESLLHMCSAFTSRKTTLFHRVLRVGVVIDGDDEKLMQAVKECSHVFPAADGAGAAFVATSDPLPAPFLPPATYARDPVRRSVLENRLALPPTFAMPFTPEDSEAINTMSFSLVVFSTEMRNLLVAVEDSLQHRPN
ncbi:Hypothetical protein, putative, partial [Bodo saltans]